MKTENHRDMLDIIQRASNHQLSKRSGTRLFDGNVLQTSQSEGILRDAISFLILFNSAVLDPRLFGMI